MKRDRLPAVLAIARPSTRRVSCISNLVSCHPLGERQANRPDEFGRGDREHLAHGVNNRGEVAGASDLAGDAIFHGFLWTKETGRMQDLAPFSPDVYSVGLAINDPGVVVGGSP